MTAALKRLIAQELEQPSPPAVVACAAYLARHFGPATAAVLFYGAGLRAPGPGALLDFYVVTDDLRMLPALSRAAAYALPPNVYAFAVPVEGGAQTCKVAVLTLDAFQRGMRAFAPQLWARFAQVVSLAYVRDEVAKTRLIAAQATAIETAMTATLPLLSQHFSAEELWRRVFTETYAAELRPESTARADALIAAAPERYRAITAAVLDAGAPRRGNRAAAQAAWFLRRRWGKLLNALRLMKAAFTYTGGLDYAVAKIARHSGVTVPVTDADRRRPLLAGIRIFLEAKRKGGVR